MRDRVGARWDGVQLVSSLQRQSPASRALRPGGRQASACEKPLAVACREAGPMPRAAIEDPPDGARRPFVRFDPNVRKLRGSCTGAKRGRPTCHVRLRSTAGSMPAPLVLVARRARGGGVLAALGRSRGPAALALGEGRAARGRAATSSRHPQPTESRHARRCGRVATAVLLTRTASFDAPSSVVAHAGRGSGRGLRERGHPRPRRRMRLWGSPRSRERPAVRGLSGRSGVARRRRTSPIPWGARFRQAATGDVGALAGEGPAPGRGALEDGCRVQQVWPNRSADTREITSCKTEFQASGEA